MSLKNRLELMGRLGFMVREVAGGGSGGPAIGLLALHMA
jgi:hypothetical protein